MFLVETCGGTAQGAACVFPFTYNGKKYNSCTTVNNSNKRWCATESVYKSQWGNCDCGMRNILLAVFECRSLSVDVLVAKVSSCVSCDDRGVDVLCLAISCLVVCGQMFLKTFVEL